MIGDWGFVVWIIVLAVPLGIILATGWARSRRAGEQELDRQSPENLDETT